MSAQQAADTAQDEATAAREESNEMTAAADEYEAENAKRQQEAKDARRLADRARSRTLGIAEGAAADDDVAGPGNAAGSSGSSGDTAASIAAVAAQAAVAAVNELLERRHTRRQIKKKEKDQRAAAEAKKRRAEANKTQKRKTAKKDNDKDKPDDGDSDDMPKPDVVDLASPTVAAQQCLGCKHETPKPHGLMMHNKAGAVDDNAEGVHDGGGRMFSVDADRASLARPREARGRLVCPWRTM